MGKNLIDRIKENKVPFLFLTGAIVLDKLTTYFGLSNPNLFLEEGNFFALSNYLINKVGVANAVVIHGCLQELLVPLGFAKVDEIFEKNHFPNTSKLGMYAVSGINYIAAVYNFILSS